MLEIRLVGFGVLSGHFNQRLHGHSWFLGREKGALGYFDTVDIC
jgi:hypothetical protein